jgi:hypothetical protein
MKRITVAHQEGPYRIHAEVLFVGNDLVVSIWGGSKPHVGAVALSIPRPSLKNSTKISSTSSVLTRLGHKEDEIVKKVAEKISATLNKVVVVSAGIHWDTISDEGISTIHSVCEILTDRLIKGIRGKEE